MIKLKKEKETLKSERGITLIALVVTIVVLLILAGVSISLVLGNNGLITKAKDARDAYNQGAINDETAMNNVYDEIESIVGISTGGNGGTSVDISELAIGDYVNYTYDEVADGYSLPKSQSGYSSDQTVAQSSTTLKWRILNIDEESGKIDLVSAEPTSNAVYFKGALGYNNGVYLLNEMCAALYSNSSKGITARSINLEDTEKHLTETGIAARNAYTQSSSGTQYGSTKTYTYSYSYYPNLYAQEIGSGVNVVEANASSISQPDLSISNPDPYKESKGYYTSATTETYTQASEKALTVTQTYYNGVTFNEANYGEAGAVLTSSNTYWVASRYAGCNSSYARFGLRRASTRMSGNDMFYSDNNTYNIYNLLRPVVSLESNVLDGTKDASGAWNLK